MTLLKKKRYLQQEHSEIWHNRSSLQLEQTGGRSGQAVIKSQMKYSLTHGSCRFHECRNANIFLTSHQEPVHGVYAWVLILLKENHAVMKPHQPETGPSAGFISDKTRSSIMRSSLMKTSYYAKVLWILHVPHTPGKGSQHCTVGWVPLFLSLTHIFQAASLSVCLSSTERSPTTALDIGIRAKCQVLHW